MSETWHDTPEESPADRKRRRQAIWCCAGFVAIVLGYLLVPKLLFPALDWPLGAIEVCIMLVLVTLPYFLSFGGYAIGLFFRREALLMVTGAVTGLVVWFLSYLAFRINLPK